MVVAERPRDVAGAVDEQAHELVALGAPIFDYTGAVRAALSIGGMKSLVLGRDRELALELLVEGAQEISATLGQHPT